MNTQKTGLGLRHINIKNWDITGLNRPYLWLKINKIKPILNTHRENWDLISYTANLVNKTFDHLITRAPKVMLTMADHSMAQKDTGHDGKMDDTVHLVFRHHPQNYEHDLSILQCIIFKDDLLKEFFSLSEIVTFPKSKTCTIVSWWANAVFSLGSCQCPLQHTTVYSVMISRVKAPNPPLNESGVVYKIECSNK